MIEQQLLDICNEFKADASKTGKEALLEKYADNEDFKQYLISILDPKYTYGLQDKKISKFLKTAKTRTSDHVNILTVLNHLSLHNTGTDKIAENVAEYIKGLPTEELQRFAMESITKKMKLGITAKTVNKIYGKGYITNFEIMLAKKFEDEQHKIKGRKFFITEKYDGQRCVIFYDRNENSFIAFSRSGEKIEGLVDIKASMSKLPSGVYDGELLIETHEQLKDREVLQETLKITRKDGDKHGVHFYIFDFLTLEEFADGQSQFDYETRRVLLNNFKVGEHIVVAPVLYEGSDTSVIDDMIEAMNNKGREGLMLNIADEKYVCKRTHHILKVKTMETADLKVIGFEKGKPLGKYENTLGTLVVDYKGYPLGVSGFSDDMRDGIWNNQDKYLGKIIEVSYFRESKNDNGGLSVSFPQFKGFRDDKTEPSYY